MHNFVLFVPIRALKRAAFSACEPQSQWQLGTIVRFRGESSDEILQVAEHWEIGSCSPGQSSMAAVRGGFSQFYA